MVNVNELKRNNYLFQKSRGIAVQIDNPRGLHHITAWGVDWPIEDFENILLTPELLERCGFEWGEVPDTDGGCEHNIYTAQWGDFEATMPDNDIFELEGFVMPHIKHLHQLQNLYFDLTGEELNIPLI